MHELSLCEDLLRQVTALAHQHQAKAVALIRVQIGQLAGVEPLLLESAYSIARIGTVAEQAELLTELVPPVVFCHNCGEESQASPTDLRCPACQSVETRVVKGEELILARVELMVEDEPEVENNNQK